MVVLWIICTIELIKYAKLFVPLNFLQHFIRKFSDLILLLVSYEVVKTTEKKFTQ